MYIKKAVFLFSFFFLNSCGLNKSLKLVNIPLDLFKKDRLACNNLRKSMIPKLKNQRESFLGVSENNIFYSLGRYDYQTIDNKNEKVFVYFLESGEQCENIRNRTKAHTLILKFNSVSLVKEAIIQTGGHE